MTTAHSTPRPIGQQPRVALVAEGTYPVALGGVSVWCDQLMRGLPEHLFEFVALTEDRSAPALWDPPSNLSAVRFIPLWTPSQVQVRRIGRSAESAAADLLAVLVRPVPEDPDDARGPVTDFIDALRRIAECARERGHTAGLFTVDSSVRVLGDSWREVAGSTLTLRDALDWGDLLEHLLRPLQEPVVRADVVHAAMNGPSMLVAMTAHWERQTPVVLSEHGTYLRERYLLESEESHSPAVRFLRLSFFRYLSAASYQVASAIAPHSRYNRRWQLRCGADPERLSTMYNGVSHADFPALEPEPDTPTVCYLGRLHPVKDIETLLRSFAIVHRVLPTARLRIYGTAPLGQEGYLRRCWQLVADLGIGDRVAFEGHAPSAFDAYRDASVVALSSISEGFPFSVVEAMSCGRAVVCTDVGGVAEAVGDGGLLVPPQDPSALARALVTVLEDSEARTRMAAVARLRVHERFTAERWSAAYGELYARLLRPQVIEPARSAGQAEAVLTP